MSHLAALNASALRPPESAPALRYRRAGYRFAAQSTYSPSAGRAFLRPYQSARDLDDLALRCRKAFGLCARVDESSHAKRLQHRCGAAFSAST
jgi:hypothetical protein